MHNSSTFQVWMWNAQLHSQRLSRHSPVLNCKLNLKIYMYTFQTIQTKLMQSNTCMTMQAQNCSNISLVHPTSNSTKACEMCWRDTTQQKNWLLCLTNFTLHPVTW